MGQMVYVKLIKSTPEPKPSKATFWVHIFYKILTLQS